MDVLKSTCPVCESGNDPEVRVCRNCGARLKDPVPDSEHKTNTSDMQALTPEMIREWLLDAEGKAVPPQSGIAFYVKGLSRPAYSRSEEEIILGRKIGATAEGLLDLAPFGGYSLGVSRRHVIVRPAQEGFEVLDIGSINGTWLNEERLVPHQPYPLPSGSHLRLGRMQLLVLYPSPEQTK